MSKDNGGPAFPCSASDGCGSSIERAGMTLRDYFAAKAMQGILANPGQLDVITESAILWVTADSYRVADAMLKARESE
ncbi:hypothetical protein WI984_002082 [Klebsiella aerogenes]|nr:hypothetical protein [Klebsiella aerogenes]